MKHSKRGSLFVSCTVFALAAVVLPACVQDLGVGDAVVDADDVAGDAKAIVGGASTTIDQHPWQVSVQQDGSHFCGGSIIAPTWVLTAQHCVDGQTTDGLTVVAGATRLSRASEGQTRAVAQIVRFPGYMSPELGRDVALLKLSSPLSFNAKVQPIALALEADNATPAGATATVSGWGTTRAGGSTQPDQLKSVTVPLVSMTTAQRAYSETLTADQLAAGTGGRDSCQGDSGGPLSALASRGRVLIGVVSWGYGCGDASYPGLYARVTAYSSWIAQTTGLSVGGSSSPSTPVTTPSSTLLDQAVSGAAGSFQHFAITVPAGATSLDVVLSGNNGDADLYVRAGRRPTANLFDCRPYLDTANEVCRFANPPAGTWYVSVAGYVAYSNTTLTVVAR